MPHVTSHDGLELAYERTGSGAPLFLIHANGFCKELWRPVVRLLPGFDAVALDQRGHGSSSVGTAPFDWWDLGRDVLTLVAALGPASPRVGVGHSSGGAAMAMSEILHPGTWDRLVLIEPITFPESLGRDGARRMVEAALRRREAFATREEARAAFYGRGPFARWTDEMLELYVEHGFRDGADGRRHLACAPETEAEYYRVSDAHGTWGRLGEIRCPVTIVVGSGSDTHPDDFAISLTAQFGTGELVSVSRSTHFVPMEQPEEIARVIGTTRH